MGDGSATFDYSALGGKVQALIATAIDRLDDKYDTFFILREVEEFSTATNRRDPRPESHSDKTRAVSDLLRPRQLTQQVKQAGILSMARENHKKILV